MTTGEREGVLEGVDVRLRVCVGVCVAVAVCVRVCVGVIVCVPDCVGVCVPDWLELGVCVRDGVCVCVAVPVWLELGVWLADAPEDRLGEDELVADTEPVRLDEAVMEGVRVEDHDLLTVAVSEPDCRRGTHAHTHSQSAV